MSQIRLMTLRAGDQGQGREYELPITWDADRNIGINKTPSSSYSYQLNVNGTAEITSSLRLGAGVLLSESTDRSDLLYINSQTSGYGGLQIGNTSNEFIFSLMGDGNTGGLYDDLNGDWLIQFTENSEVRLYHNGSEKLNTSSTGVTVTGDLVVSGGDITLSGTGRIQGVDTVSAGTDAANKNYVDNAVSGAGTVTSVATGDGLTGGTITGSGTISVDYGINGIMNDCPNGSGVPEEDDTIMVGLDSAGQGEAVKFSIVDLPFTSNVGDITAVTAGSGLSGGGTSGGVTVNVDYGATSNVIMDTGNVNSLEGKDFFLFADFSDGNKVYYTDLSTLSGYISSSIGSFSNLTINNILNVRGVIDLADNDILRFGSGDDVEMFFNGSDMFMDINNGEDFKIRDGNSGNAVRFTFDADNGNFTATGNITAFSDERLKDNIETLDGSKVLDMRGVSYTKDGKAGSGVIAQELEKVAPELVMTNEKEDGMKSVAYGNLVGYLIEAVKDQQKQIDELKAQLDGISK